MKKLKSGIRPGARLLLAWHNLLASLWFLPALIILAGVALAAGMIALDEIVGDEAFVRMPRLFGASAEGARSLLAAVATAMVTIAGVAFSITIVVLGLAASQYSSRVLRTFMASRVNQATLGVLMSIFVYCLIVLRTIRGGEEAFVPSIAVITGIALAFVGIGFFVYYIHHTASSIQASRILELLARDTLRAIDACFGECLGDIAPQPREPRPAAWRSVAARTSGYVQTVDVERLVSVAGAHRCIVRMDRGIGDFVIEGMPLVSIGGGCGDCDDELRDAYALGSQRTVDQDPAFGIRQIVDVALRALSPGINDTTTAQMCLDHLSAILARLAGRRIARPLRLEDGEVRVIARGPTFEVFVALAFDQIRSHGRDNAALLQQLLTAVERVACFAHEPSQRAALADQVRALGDALEALSGGERDALARRTDQVLHSIMNECGAALSLQEGSTRSRP